MLTLREKSKIRLYLGFPDGFRYKNTRLESILENLSEEAEELIRECLVGLKAVDDGALEVANTVAATASVTAAGIKRVDEIWFETGKTTAGAGTQNAGFKTLKDAGKYFAGRLSIIVGVPIANNAFGSGGFGGDGFAPGNGGGIIPLG
jgi:hypothetical protein